MIMPKNIKLARSSFFMLIVTGLLNLLFPIFVCYLICCFFFVRNVDRLLFYYMLGILLLRPYESIKTSDSY